MTFALAFWILMFLWLIFGFWGWYRPMPNFWYGHGLFLFILFLLIGWKIFGQPLHP